MSKRQEVLDFKLRAYRTHSNADERFQNYRQASTTYLELVVEIDGIEIPIASQSFPMATWERAMKMYDKA